MNSKRRRAGLWCLGLLLACATAAAVTLTGMGCGGKCIGPPEDEVDTGDDFVLPRGPQLFEEVRKQTGINWGYKNGEDKGHLAIIESLGGGVGLLDFDGDGLLDLLVLGGGDFAKTDKDLGPRPQNPHELAPSSRR